MRAGNGGRVRLALADGTTCAGQMDDLGGGDRAANALVCNDGRDGGFLLRAEGLRGGAVGRIGKGDLIFGIDGG